jgi:hypothetical protein
MDKPNFAQMLEQQIAAALDSAVQDTVKKTLDMMVLDPTWLAKIESLVNQQVTQRVLEKISAIDVNTIIAGEIDNTMDRWKAKLLADFKSTGITDHATSCQLVVMDEAVVAQGGLASNDLLVESFANVRGTLNVKDLIVTGTVNTDNRSWQELADSMAARTRDSLTAEWRGMLVQDVLTQAKEQGIDFSNISINGIKVVDGNSLSGVITESNLESVGTLHNLSVAGTAKIGNDVLSVGQRRVGVNTADPEMALGIWDEEVSVLAGKLSKDNAYIGTGRKQKLSIGVDKVPQIELDPTGLTTIRNLRLDRFRIAFAASIPGYAGTRGDVIINSDPKADSPFAWRCLGGFKWEPVWGNK